LRRSALTLALLARGSVRTTGSFTDPAIRKASPSHWGSRGLLVAGEGKPPTVDSPGSRRLGAAPTAAGIRFGSRRPSQQLTLLALTNFGKPATTPRAFDRHPGRQSTFGMFRLIASLSSGPCVLLPAEGTMRFKHGSLTRERQGKPSVSGTQCSLDQCPMHDVALRMTATEHG
jgi:hypothetical protein